jgi:cold shock CspA family protein
VYKSITAALAANQPDKGPLTITASGICNENVTLQRSSSIAVVGNPIVTINPAQPGNPTVVALGTIYLNSVKIASGASGLGIYAGAGANLTLSSSSITGTGGAIYQPSGGTLSLFNSSVTTTGGGISLTAGALVLDASNNGTVSVIGSGDGIGCGQCHGIDCEQCHIELATDATGKILLSDNPAGAIFCVGCIINTYGVNNLVTISNNNQGNGFALDLRGGFATLIHVNILNNGGFGGLSAGQGASVELGNSSIRGNKSAGVQATLGGIVHYAGYDGNTTVTGNGYNFGCYQGGKQYADDKGNLITPGPISACVQVGGP